MERVEFLAKISLKGGECSARRGRREAVPVGKGGGPNSAYPRSFVAKKKRGKKRRKRACTLPSKKKTQLVRHAEGEARKGHSRCPGGKKKEQPLVPLSTKGPLVSKKKEIIWGEKGGDVVGVMEKGNEVDGGRE